MLRTVELRLPYHRVLVETTMQFKDGVQIFLNYGFENKTSNKNRLNRGKYRKVRESIPTVYSTLLKKARNTSETLKAIILEKKIKRWAFKFYPNSHTLSLTTVQGRLVFPVSHTSIIGRYRVEYTNAKLVINKKKGIFAMVQVDLPEKEVINKQEYIKVIGKEKGIKNIAILSNNVFFNSRHLREVKGRFQYLKINLQHLGTSSAKRKIERRERMFLHDLNYVISRNIVSLPCNVVKIEASKPAKMKKYGKGKKFTRNLKSLWTAEMAKFIKYRAEDSGNKVIHMDPKHISQKYSRCGYVSKENGHGSMIKYKKCGFEFSADLNFSGNIRVPGMPENLRLLSASQSLQLDETPLTGGGVTG